MKNVFVVVEYEGPRLVIEHILKAFAKRIEAEKYADMLYNEYDKNCGVIEVSFVR